MTYLPKPKIIHPGLKKNELGMTVRDYEGALSTLCAGCGHDSVTAAIIQAAWEVNLAPHRVAKMSGIGCSSKTPAYFLSTAHGFNSVHGRMPSVTTGANAAARELTYLGVSGDGDTASIGLGQFAHAIRRRLKMVYIVENNGAYGLTKGQFSATATLGSKSKKGDMNLFLPIDPALFALQLGASFVAKSFSGDKTHLVPILKKALLHPGFALVDVISPCITFNNHEGSTKSYRYTRANSIFELLADHQNEDRSTVAQRVGKILSEGKIPLGIYYEDKNPMTMHDIFQSDKRSLRDIPYHELCPSQETLKEIQKRYR